MEIPQINKAAELTNHHGIAKLHTPALKMQKCAWTHTSCSNQQYSAQLVPVTLLQDEDWETNLVPLLLTHFNLLNSQ